MTSSSANPSLPAATSWSDGFAAYVETAYEVRLHRRMNTFGGVLWPTKTNFLEIAIAALDNANANKQ